jgi:hypothetical protein
MRDPVTFHIETGGRFGERLFVIGTQDDRSPGSTWPRRLARRRFVGG